MRSFNVKNVHRLNLKKGSDLYYSINNYVVENNIKSGIIAGIGAVSKAHIAFFNQYNKQFDNYHFEEPMEIVSLKGNVSLKNGSPFSHIHIVLARSDYSVIGGHLLGDTIIYAAEVDIVEFEGIPVERKFDDDTNLYLWSF